VKGPPFFLVCGGRGVFFFPVVFGVESGLSTVSLSTWTMCPVDFPCKHFIKKFGLGGGSKQRVPKFLICSPKEMNSMFQNITFCFEEPP